MKSVRVRREELLAILLTNREDHRKIFEDAIKGFRADAIKQLDQRIADLKAGMKRSVLVSVSAPQDHTFDYNRAVKMVQMSISDEIELSEADFQNYVMDNWEWTRQFVRESFQYGSDLGKNITRTKYGDEE